MLGEGAAVHLSAAMLDSKRGWPVRTGAAWVLGEIASESARTGLETAWGLADAPATFRVQVAISLGAMGDREKLRSYLTTKNKDKVIVAKAAIAIANQKDVEAVDLLKPLLKDEDIGSFIALAVCRLGDPAGVEQVRPLLRDGVFRDFAAVALGTTGDKTVLLPLRFALANPDPFIRRDAALLLGKFGDEESREKLKDLARKDSDPRVREAAIRAVKRLPRR